MTGIGTFTALAPSNTMTYFTGALTLFAIVVPTSGSTTPTGNLEFLIDGTPAGTVPLSAAGLATYTPSGLTAGTHQVQASYVANGAFEASSSLVETATFEAAPTPSEKASCIGTGFGAGYSEVALSDACGVTIYYTLDGSTPTSSSKVYSGPFSLDEGTAVTLEAIAIGPGFATSAVGSWKLSGSCHVPQVALP